jgi:hypothetical protein
VTSGGIAKAPRWRLAIAVVAALSLFTAVTTGWALRGSTLAQTAGPLPAAWQTTHAAAHGSAPVHQVPAKHVWMARERPQSWNPLSPQSDWSALPASFAPRWPAVAALPDGTHSRPPAATPAGRDISTNLCIDRR